MLAAVAGAGLFGYACPRQSPPTPRRPSAAATSRRSDAPLIMSVGDLLVDAADGDISAALEAAALAIAGLGSVGLAWSLVEREEAEDVDTPPAAGEVRKVDVDLGPNGEPKGEQRLFFKPLLPRSEFVQLDLRVPLGLVIEERQLSSPQQQLIDELAAGGPAPAGGAAGGSVGTIEVTGALPGYSAFEKVEQGDLLRAVTAYAAVAGDAPMWQQALYLPISPLSPLICPVPAPMWQQAASPLRDHFYPNPNPRPSPDLDLNPSPKPSPCLNPNLGPNLGRSSTSSSP